MKIEILKLENIIEIQHLKRKLNQEELIIFNEICKICEKFAFLHKNL